MPLAHPVCWARAGAYGGIAVTLTDSIVVDAAKRPTELLRGTAQPAPCGDPLVKEIASKLIRQASSSSSPECCNPLGDAAAAAAAHRLNAVAFAASCFRVLGLSTTVPTTAGA